MKTNHYTRGTGILEGFLAKKRTAKANSLLKKVKKGKILDIGCGSYPYFLLNNDFAEKYGIDPSLKNTKLKNIELKNLDVTKSKLPFKDNFFDAVTMLAVFEHLDHKKIHFVLDEINRVLKKDGTLVITTPAPWSDKILKNMARLSLVSKEEIHEHKHNLTSSVIKSHIVESGFKKTKSGYFELGLNMWFTAIK